MLSTAMSTFTELGTEVFADLARGELLAAGGGGRPGAPGVTSGGLTDLTPQQRRIAQLAAQGLRNPEIARRLVLSRTPCAATCTGCSTSWASTTADSSLPCSRPRTSPLPDGDGLPERRRPSGVRRVGHGGLRPAGHVRPGYGRALAPPPEGP